MNSHQRRLVWRETVRHQTMCPRCDGRGWFYAGYQDDDEPCFVCNAQGRIDDRTHIGLTISGDVVVLRRKAA